MLYTPLLPEAASGAVASGTSGPKASSWSNRTLHAITDRFLKGRPDVAVIDFHTGLGPYGFGEIMSNHSARDPGHTIMQQWWGSAPSRS